MARYIDANKLSRDVISSWDRDTHKTIEASRIHRQEHHHLMSIIEKQPTADVAEVKHGEWIEVDDGIDIGSGKHLECSICEKWKKDRIKSNYCPNCGAKMDGGKKE